MAILVPKLVIMATTIWHSISAMSSSDSLTQKPTPRMKLRVASYHTTKVIAHQTPKSVIANCVPKLVGMATSLSTYGPPSNNWFLWPIRAHNPNGIPIGSAVFAQTTVDFTMGRPFSPKNLPLPMGGSGPPSNTWFPGPTQVLNPKGSSIGAAFFAGLTSVTDRQTDRPRYSVGKNRPHLRT